MSAASRPPPVADDVQILLDAFRRIVQALRVAERGAQSSVGLSAAQLFVLRALERERRPLDLRALAGRARTHHSSVSVVVQRLVERGLVSRRRASDDARRAQVALTAAGRRVLTAAPEAPQAALIGYLSTRPAATRRRLARELERLATAVCPAGAPAPMFFADDASRAPARRRA
ncbi:MAG: MarR family winged helix-turn-helix transcriptional regulator [bacterium]